MTEAQALAAIEAHHAAQEAERKAARALITPHVRRAPAKQPRGVTGPRYFNLMRAIENDTTGAYADYRPTNYCGAPLTSEDWDRRTALAKSNAQAVIDGHVCPACLTAARGETR